MSQYILLDVAVAKSSNEIAADYVVGVIDCLKWVVRAVFRELADLRLTLYASGKTPNTLLSVLCHCQESDPAHHSVLSLHG